MKKLLLPLWSILSLIACQKQIPDENMQQEISATTAGQLSSKISVCHYDAQTDTWKTISVSANALPAHKAHGDVLGDCNTIQTVTICNQTWMLKNLDVNNYRNGDAIPQVTDPTQWAKLTTGAWCYYGNNPANDEVYGKLYNWFAVNDPRGLAPEGWHIPTDEEWTTLENCLGGASVAGDKLKEAGTTHWAIGNNGNNSSGFTALPGAFRGIDGAFGDITFNGDFWSSSYYVNYGPWARGLVYYFGDVSRFFDGYNAGLSVRCLRN